MKTLTILVILTVLFVMPSFSQTGPASVGNSTGASGQPENILWLDANDLGLANNAAVGNWADKSGNANNVSQTGAAQPTYKNALDANYSFPAVSFDGTDDFFPIDGNLLVGTNYTLIIVGSRKTGGREVILGGSAGATNQNFHPYFNTSALHSHHYGNDHNAGYTGGAGSVANATTPDFGIFGFRLNADLATEQRAMFQNGSPIGTRNDNRTLTSYANATIASYRGEFSDIEIAEIIIYADALNDVQITILSNYLSSKYDITLDSNDFYAGDTPANGDFDNNVTGLGQDNAETVLSASTNGFYITSDASLDTDGEFVFVGEDNIVNAVSTANVEASVEERWAKAWYVDKTSAGTLGATISFDFIEGIAGQFPAGDKNNYVLLRDNAGTFEIVNIANGDKSILGTKVNFLVSDTDLVDGIYTLGTLDNTDSPILGSPNQIWYAGKSGNWTDPTVWTLDGSAFPVANNPLAELPDPTDNVVINNGSVVTMVDNNRVVAGIEVIGTLNVAATSGHNFSNIAGIGTIRLSGAAGVGNFPLGSVTDFADDFSGGTVEYYGSGLTISNQRTFNNVSVVLTNVTDELVLMNDMFINGDLNINRGVFQINDDASTTTKNMEVNGAVFIDTDASMTVGQGNTRGGFTIVGNVMPGNGQYHSIFHTLTFKGDFTNQGTVRFTNQTAPVYNEFTSTGAATVIFGGAANTSASLSGTTDFYNLIINKGNDQTYEVEISAANATNFGLYGPNSVGRVSNGSFTASNPEVRKALWVYNGTLHLTGNVQIPTLSEGNQNGGNGDYPIGQNAGLWIDGAGVSVYSTADVIGQVPAGAAGINGGGSNQALSLYGSFRISDGVFGTRGSAGFIFWNASAGAFLIEGGMVNVSQFRSAQAGNSTYSYTQTGGDVLVRANEGVPGETSNTYDLFSLDIPEAVFTMSGGTLTVYGTRSNAIFIGSKVGNYTVTGGEVIVENRNGNIATIASTAPFWNLTVKKDQAGDAGEIDLITSTSGVTTLTDPNLVVLNNFTIEAGIIFDHNGNDVTIGSDFTIEAGADYVYDGGKPNTTSFIGADNATMTFLNRTGGGGDEQRFWNLVIDRPSGVVMELESGKVNRNGNDNNLLRVDGDSFKVLSGTLNQGTHSIRMYADTLVNYDVMTTYNPANFNNDPASNGDNDILKLRDDISAATIFVTADSSRFGAIKLNSNNEIITLSSDVKIDYLDYRHGRFNIQDNNLTIDFLDDNLTNEAEYDVNQNGTLDGGVENNIFSPSDMIIADGQSSNGGLSLLITGDGNYTFPLGIGTDATELLRNNSKYTPASVTVSNFSDDGYITIRPVDNFLGTTDPIGDILSYYWRVDFQDFTTPPTVEYQFTYYDDDLDGSGNEAIFVAGKVEQLSPFLRRFEDDNLLGVPGAVQNEGVNVATNVITFNGDADTGFTLEEASYTAGEPARFIGNVQAFYTRVFGNSATALWRDGNRWTLATNDIDGNGTVDPDEVHDSRQPVAGDFPQAGDIAIIGWVPWEDPNTGRRGQPQGLQISATENVAELRFTQMLDITGNPTERFYSYNFQFRPTLCINPNGAFDPAGGTIISGEGMFWLRSTGGNRVDPDFSIVDLGDFVDQDSSYLAYESTQNGTYNNIPTETPNLLIAGNGWGAQNRDFGISTDVNVRGDFELLGDVNLILSSGATGDITVDRTLRIFRNNANGNDSGGNGELAYPNDANRTVEIFGDLEIVNAGAIVSVRNPDASGDFGQLIVHGNIIQNSASGAIDGLQLYPLINGDYINLQLRGTGNHSYTNLGGDNAGLYTVTVDKGVSTISSFSFDNTFTLGGPTDGDPKAIQLLNGNLILNDVGIDINLTTGANNFSIPSTAGLQITDGTVRASGDDTGILLDGSLIIDGGTLDMSDAVGNGNNYIEYSASGSATLEISSGFLTVGSQIRGNLITTSGVLNYVQTGGTVVVGKNAAPAADRGVFEIKNTGSNFTYTGDATSSLTLVRQNGVTPAVAAFRLLPTTYNITRPIFIGNADTPAGQSFGVNSNVPLAGLEVSSTNNPVAVIKVNELVLDGELLINTGATFNADGISLVLNSDFTNNGVFIPNGNTTTFASTISQSLSGSGTNTFFKFRKMNDELLEIEGNVTVTDLFSHEAGTIDAKTNTIDLKSNAVIEGELSATGAEGLKFSGATQQQLQRLTSGTTTLGVVTISNPSGVVIPEANGYNYRIEGNLQMNGGIFNIGSSAVTMGQSGDITTSGTFSATNMVKTNSSFSDNGLTKVFSAGYNSNFVFPIGEIFYTPVSFDFSVAGGTSGTTVGTIAAKPANEPHPVVNDGGPDDYASGDVNNVLQYYWTLRSSTINGLVADVDFNYDQSHVLSADGGVTEATYISARILAFDNATNEINKFTTAEVDEAGNLINFPSTLAFNGVVSNGVSGDYFAGDNLAIPDNVATYTTQLALGDVTSSATYVEGLPSDGSAPSGAVLVVSSGTEITFNVPNVQLYKTIIESGATLNIDDTDGHRLGFVEGTGNLKITANAPSINAPLPAADYGTFFSCTGGGLEYAGTGNYSILSGVSTLRNLVLSDPTGTGIRNFPNNNVTICEDLVIGGTADINGPTINLSSNRTLNVNNDLIVNSGILSLGAGGSSRAFIYRDFKIDGGVVNGSFAGGIGVFGSIIVDGGIYNLGTGSHFVILRGNFELISGQINKQSSTVTANNSSFEQRFVGDFTGVNAFYNLTIDNRTGSQDFFVDGDMEISNRLNLNDGKLILGVGNLLSLSATASFSPTNGRASSYVVGKVTKEITSAGGNFTFPIGSANMWRPAVVKNVSTGGLTWEAQFWDRDVLANTIANTIDPTNPLEIKSWQLGEYWIISDGVAAPPGVTANVGLSWGIETDVSSNSTERQELQVMAWNAVGSTWDNFGGGTYSAGNSQSQGSFESTATVGFSENILVVGSGDLANPLPVELVSFTAEVQNNAVQLDWITATEKDNDFFEVQRSFDGESFETIGLVEGNGTVSYEVVYGFKDIYPLNGRSFYRLKQLDYDGDYEYSPIVQVNLEVASKLRLFPNPTTDQAIYLTLDGFHNVQDVHVKIFNLQGRNLYDDVLSPDELYRKPLPIKEALNPGIYIIEVVQGNTSKQVRLAIR